jgi:MFS family permease
VVDAASKDNQRPLASTPRSASRGRWYLLLILVLSLIMCNIDRNVLSVLLEPIRQEFKLHDWQLGLLSGLVFTTLYCAGSLAVSRLADRSDRVWIISGALLAWSFLTFVCGQAGSFAQLLLARAGVGFTESGSQAPAHALIADRFEGGDRSLAMGIFASGALIGMLLALPIGGYLERLWGWRGAFAAVSLPGILLAIIVRLTLRDRRWPIREARRGPTAVTRAGLGADSRALLTDPCVRHLIIAGTLATLPSAAILSFGVSILVRARGLSPWTAGVTFGFATGACGIVGAVGAGWLVSRLVGRDHRWRCWTPMATQLAGAPLQVGFLFLPTAQQAIFAGAIGGVFGAAWLGPTFAAMQDCAGPKRRATASALLLVSYNFVGFGFGPLLAGAFSDWFRPAFGENSLGVSLLALQPFAIWAALHFLLAARYLPRNTAAYAVAG